MRSKDKVDEHQDFLHFTIGKYSFITPLPNVQEVLSVPELTPVPKGPSFVQGLATVRGEILPVVNLAQQLQVADTTTEGRHQILVIRGPERKVGFLVETVCDVIEISSSAMKLAATELSEGLLSEYLIGVAKTDKGILLIIDFEKLLSLEDMDLSFTDTLADDKRSA